MDYWSDWVAFVSPRVFLFHRLFPPEILGKKKTKQISSLFIQLQLLLDRSTVPLGAHCVPVSQLWPGATQRAVLGKDTDIFKIVSAETRQLEQGPGAESRNSTAFSLYKGVKGCQRQMGKVPFSQSVNTG